MSTAELAPRFDFETFLQDYRAKTTCLKATVEALCGGDDEDNNLDAEEARQSISSDLDSLNQMNMCLKNESDTYEQQLATVDEIKERFTYMTETVDALSNALATQTISGDVVLPAKKSTNEGKPGKKASNVETGEARKMDRIPQIETITSTEMNTVPSYMKGRMKAETINQFVDKFNRAILMKYQILSKPMKNLKPDEKRNIFIYKQQETDQTKGLFFCTFDDMNEFSNYKFCNSTNSMVTILRHCKRIREIREGKKPGLLVCM